MAVNTYAPSKCDSSDRSRVDNSFAVQLAIGKVILEYVSFRVFELLLLSYSLRGYNLRESLETWSLKPCI